MADNPGDPKQSGSQHHQAMEPVPTVLTGVTDAVPTRITHPVEQAPRTWMELAKEIGLREGLTGLMLLAACYFLWTLYSDTKQNVPVWIKAIQAGYERIEVDHRQDVQVRDKQVDRIVGVLEREQEQNRAEYKLMSEQHGTMKALLDEVRLQRSMLKGGKQQP